MGRGRTRKSWGFVEGDEIIPGRIALENLGGGWDFEVFLVWDDHLHSLVVAKVVRPNLVHDERILRSLAREAGLLERLAHPVIVRGFGATLDGDRPHLLLEHLEGVALSAAIRSAGRLDLHQLVPLAYQLASGLQYLANEQVVHLDVKPDNVILGVPPRLVDLSIARTVEDAARLRSPVGTDAFMAPEQVRPGDRARRNTRRRVGARRHAVPGGRGSASVPTGQGLRSRRSHPAVPAARG